MLFIGGVAGAHGARVLEYWWNGGAEAAEDRSLR